MSLTVLQLLPALDVGGVERGTIEIANALVKAGHRAIVVSAGGRLLAELEGLGATHINLPIGKKSLTTLRYISQLKRIFREQKVDIVHARSRLPAWIGHLALKGMSRSMQPHWITTVHGPYSVNRYSEIMVGGERVIAISEFIRDYILSNYPRVAADKISVIHRGVDENLFNPDFKPDAAWQAAWQSEYDFSGQKILLFPGRLTRWKGQLAFVSLIEKLRARSLSVCGLFAGGQSDPKSGFEQELRQQIALRGLESSIHFLGPRSDMRELFAISDLSFSLTDVPEAFGRTTLEALAMGTPVIGYEHGGTGEILRQIFPLGLVRTGDLDQVAEKTIALIKTPPVLPRKQPMTLAAMQNRTLEIYQQLVGN